ncbi:hypothetical protein D3C87_460350 [compost metagenome]
MTKIIVGHHASCMDGTGAKFAAWKKFGDTAKYVPLQYGQPIPDFGNDYDTELYILDFSFSKEVTIEFTNKYKKFVVLDHHKTAEAELKDLISENIIFDMNKSGAGLAWEYFHPGVPMPELIAHIQDRDLWKFRLAGSKEVHAGLGLLKGSMGLWDKYIEPSEQITLGNKTPGFNPYKTGPMKELVNTGKGIIEYENNQISNTVPKRVKIIELCGYKVGVVNSGYLVSETGAAICNDPTLKVDAAMMYFIDVEDKVFLSFRSKSGSNVDVSVICKQYFEGGGHPAAAGGRCDIATLEKILKGTFQTIHLNPNMVVLDVE